MPERERRWNGWGVAGERFPVPDAARAFLAERLGPGDPLPVLPEAEVTLPATRPLPALPLPVAADGAARLRSACGSSLPDLVALRTGAVAAFPDAVCFPETSAQVVELLRAAAAGGVTVVPRGGGTSVTGGVTVSAGDRPVVVLSLERLRGVISVDAASQLARVRAGTLGPELEAALAPHGLRLGHEPQSFEFSSVGGWVATRSAGQRSTGVGKIDDLVAGLEVATETGLWRLAAQPASAAGPELRRVLIGSEGRFGVITEATLRLRPLPEREDGLAVLLPGWAAGVEVCRALLQDGVPVETMRLADPEETRFGMTLAALSPLAARASRALFGLRRYRNGCLLLLGWAGTTQGMTLDRAGRRAAVARGGRARPRPRRLAAVARRPLPPPVPARRAARRRLGRGHAGDGCAVVRAGSRLRRRARVAAASRRNARDAGRGRLPPLARLPRRRVALLHLPLAARPRPRDRPVGRAQGRRHRGAARGGRHALPPPRGGGDPRPVPRARGGPHRGRGAGGGGARARPARRPQPGCLAFPNPEPRAPNPGRGEG